MNKKESVYHTLNRSKPGILALLDPDRLPLEKAAGITEFVCTEGISGILVGTSLLVSPHLDLFIEKIRGVASVPIIIFPGCSHQVSRKADALFFLSLLSGRNPEYLIGEQVKAVFLIREYGLETIPVGYLLIEAGSHTAVEYISATKPIPRLKPEIVVAHALAGEYLGMKYIYLEAGSGAAQHVPAEVVRRTKKALNIPLLVGGGIRDVTAARKILAAGADFIVLGSIIERSRAKFKEIMRSVR